MTVAVFLISFLLILSLGLLFAGMMVASTIPITFLAAIAFRQAYLLRRGQLAQAVLGGVPLRRVLPIALRAVIERIRDSMLFYGLSTAVKRKDVMDDVHLLPVLAAAIREQCPHNAKATALAQEAEDLYDVCTRPPE